MNRLDPYYADDTHGVLFDVCVDGALIHAHVGCAVLSRCYGVPIRDTDWVAVYRAHQEEINEAVAAHVRTHGPETVILGVEELRLQAGK